MFSALTFNMQNGQVWDDNDPDTAPVRIEDTLAFLQEQNTDIIFLQEVERGYEGGRQVEPPPNFEWLRARLPDYQGVFGYPIPNPLEIPFGLGLAIFSKFPITVSRRFELPPAEIAFEYQGVARRPSHRLMLGAECAIEGRTVCLYDTHLQAFFMINATSDEHCTQRNLVVEEIRDRGLPAILAGDFNSAPGEKIVEQFASAGYQTVQNTEITWRRMPFVLDHMFYNSHLRAENVKVIPTMASDHHAVRADFFFV